MKQIGQDISKTTKGVAKKSAKVVLEEPIEVIKQTKTQIAPTTESKTTQPVKLVEEPKEILDQKQEEELKLRSKKMIKDLEEEIEMIRKKKKQEQDETEKEEEVKVKRKEEVEKPLQEPATKPGKKGLGKAPGMKGKIEKLKRKSEIRMPPSG